MNRLVLFVFVAFSLLSCSRNREAELLSCYEKAHNLTYAEAPEKAYAALQELAEDFHEAGNWAFESACLYEMSTNYLNQRDLEGMRHTLSKMYRLTEEHPEDIATAYSFGLSHSFNQQEQHSLKT